MAKNVSNDWGQRILLGVKAVIKAEDAGEAALARLIRDDIMPYIGMRIEEGAMVWRPDSEAAMDDVLRDILEAANVASVKGLKKGTTAYRETMAAQQRIRRAVKLYAAICILGERWMAGPNWDKLLFPVCWVFDDEDGKITLPLNNGDTHQMRAIRKDQQPVNIMVDGEEGVGSVKMTTNAILRASGLATTPERAASTPNADDDAPTTGADASKAADMVASYLAKADGAPISGDMADALAPVIAQIAHNDTLWALAMAEREAWQVQQAVEQGKAA